MFMSIMPAYIMLFYTLINPVCMMLFFTVTFALLFIYTNAFCSQALSWVTVQYTQGLVLGPILFTMYIKPLSAIIDSHSIIHHSFADDLQLQMSAPPDRISELLHSMQSCISDGKA